MAYSMTGFGRGEIICDTRRYTVEIKSVNSRFCDINVRMPRVLSFADSRVRKRITDGLVRGKVDVYINYEDTDNSTADVVLNTGLAKAYYDAVGKIADMIGSDNNLTPSNLSSYPDVLTTRQKNLDEDAMGDELISCVDAAIEGMKQMRLTEGNNLAKDIIEKVAQLEKIRDEIAEKAPEVVADYRARLSQRVDELLDGDKRAFYDENRLAAEVALFADKCAIDEELKRLLSHFSQARSILGGEGAVGKKMDFLVQEINREVNTIGSKANCIDITNRVLQMKNLVEEIREQIQNLV